MVAIVGSGVVLALRGLRLWRTFTSFNGSVTTALAIVTEAAAVAELHADAVSKRTEQFAVQTARLQESIARLQVLTSAANDVRRQVNAFTRAMPKK